MFTILFLAVLALGGYLVYRKYGAKITSTVTGGTSAFAKLAEADGKIIALKVATEAKKVEALAAHSALDEVHNILG